MDKWEKLKKIINEEIENDKLQYEETLGPCFNHYAAYGMWLLDLMEGLENLELDIGIGESKYGK